MSLQELLRSVPEDRVDGVLQDVIGGRNFVTVTKHTPMRGRMRRVAHEAGEVLVAPAALLRMDHLRALAGLKPRYLEDFFSAFGGELLSVTPNLRTTAGITYVCDSIGNSGSRPVVCDWMALSENGAVPAVGDTVLTGEITTNGLQRVQATYAHSGANTFFTLAHTWTSAGVFTTVQKAALFNGSSGGTLVLENTFTPTALQSGDQITVTWTVNV